MEKITDDKYDNMKSREPNLASFRVPEICVLTKCPKKVLFVEDFD